MKTLDFILKRVIAWPSILIGLALAYTGSWFIAFGAWLTDNEDLLTKEN